MALNNKSKNNPPKDIFTLQEKVIFDYYLLKIYAVGKRHDEFAHSPNIVESLRDLVAKGASCANDEDLNNGCLVESLFNDCNLPSQSDDNENLDTNDERVINLKEKFKERALKAKENNINDYISNALGEDKDKFFSYIRKNYGITQDAFEKQIIRATFEKKGTSYPKIPELETNLYNNFDNLKRTLPNHLYVKGKIGSDIQQIIDNSSVAGKSKKYIINEKPGENKDKNRSIRDNFNKHEDAKKRFLMIVGNMLKLGKPGNSPNNIEKYLETIKNLSGCSENDQQIIDQAKNMYDTTTAGLWILKNKVNPDRLSNEDDYIKTNINVWINHLLEGRNNFRSLAFMDPDKYDKLDPNNEEDSKILAKYISVHHKIAIKYHAILDDDITNTKFDHQNKTLLHPFNQVGNLMLVIDGDLHDALHLRDKENEITIGAKDNSILLLPTDNKGGKKSFRLNIPEPGEIRGLRPKKAFNNTATQMRTSMEY